MVCDVAEGAAGGLAPTGGAAPGPFGVARTRARWIGPDPAADAPFGAAAGVGRTGAACAVGASAFAIPIKVAGDNMAAP